MLAVDRIDCEHQKTKNKSEFVERLIELTLGIIDIQASRVSLVLKAPSKLLVFSTISTTILSVTTSISPKVRSPKSLLVGLWPDADSIALQHKPEAIKEQIGFWPAIIIGTLMTMSGPGQAPSLADLGFVVISYACKSHYVVGNIDLTPPD